MARRNDTDPDATKRKLLAVARSIVVTEGLDGVSTRKVAKAAGVSATTVSHAFDGVASITRTIIEEAFDPLIFASDHFEGHQQYSIEALACAPLLADPSLARIVLQVGSYAGATGGAAKGWAYLFEEWRSTIRDYLMACEMGPRLVRSAKLTDAEVADRIIDHYFTAAHHVARDPKIDAYTLIWRL